MNKKFSDLFTFQPKSKIKAGEGQTIGKYPFFTCSPIQDKYYDSANYSGEALVFGTGGNATMHYVNGKFSTSTDCLVAYPKEETLPAYVYYYLFSDMEILQNGFRGSGLKHISKSYINDIEVPIIPKESQEKIITAMNTSLMIIKKRHEQIAVLDKLVKDIFVGMFGDPIMNEKGWEIKLLPDFYKGGRQALKCGPFGSALRKNEYSDTGIAVWTMDNITKLGEFVDEPYLRIPTTKYEELESYRVENGDVIISRAGTVGKMCVVNSIEKESIISTNLIRVRFDEELLLPEYFVWLILCFGSRIARLRTGGDDSFTHMNTGVLNSISFPYPPMELQLKFRERLNAIAIQKTRLQDSLAELETTYKSTLQKAFDGELFQ